MVHSSFVCLLDQIPLLVTMSQKNNRNVSDETFLRDLPIIFDVLIHDPSHFLNQSALYYKWKFGDNTSLLVSHDHTLNHTYMLNGTYDLNLTVQATVPGPCPSPTPAPTPSPGPLNITTRGKCCPGFLMPHLQKSFPLLYWVPHYTCCCETVYFILYLFGFFKVFYIL